MSSVKQSVIVFASISVSVFVLVASVLYSVFAISINTGRTGQLQTLDTRIQEQVGKIAIDPGASEVTGLLQKLKDLNDDRAALLETISYGDNRFWSLPFSYCLFPRSPDCFHRNASETNNLYLAMASGVLGACLFLFFRFRDQATNNRFSESGSVVYVISMISSGLIIGLLIIYLLRGTKGALLTPVADVVQVENPYGIAFACMAAAFFSDRLIAWLAQLVNPASGKLQAVDRNVHGSSLSPSAPSGE